MSSSSCRDASRPFALQLQLIRSRLSMTGSVCSSLLTAGILFPGRVKRAFPTHRDCRSNCELQIRGGVAVIRSSLVPGVSVKIVPGLNITVISLITLQENSEKSVLKSTNTYQSVTANKLSL